MSHNDRIHPIFAAILRDVELQPAMLHRAAVKADPRRFTGEPVTAFADFNEPRDRAAEIAEFNRELDDDCRDIDDYRDEA